MALMLPGGRTVTVAVPTLVPEAPVAVAVYVVVAVGETDCVPPVGLSVYELPSVPVTVTWVELTALTVSVDASPDWIDGGFATMVTIGVVIKVTVAVAVTLP